MDSLLKSRFFYSLITGLLYNRFFGKYLLKLIEKRAAAYLSPGKGTEYTSQSKKMQDEKKIMVSAIIRTINRSISSRTISKDITRETIRLWTKAIMPGKLNNPEVSRFIKENQSKPPWFLVISPGKSCNLSCNDCYAGSISGGPKLSFGLLDKIVSDAIKLWDIKLVVFSGGEPFAYHSEDKGILEIAKKYPDCLFLAFTNGTLINRDMALKIADCKNITPAISVEGMKSATDERRGEGIFEKVLNAMDHLKEAGVPFGISVTVNRENYLDVLKDEFLDFFFENKGAFYGFYFQYLPVGRNADFDRMPTPSQRLVFWQQVWEVIEKRKILLLDFWNHGTLVDGCVAAGRDGGYLHIDWDGNVTPCVFAPFSAGNIVEIYEGGGDINTIWKSGFFEAIRGWQKEYGFGKNCLEEKGNLMMSCPYRDHHPQFLEWIKKYKINPSDYGSDKLFMGSRYCNNMAGYDKELEKLMDPVWKEKYLNNKV
jgi:MoaA/NifB/PqqE/SkfB family radical SAM enzyme